MLTDTQTTADWITRFSARLHAQWPTLSRVQRDETAAEVARKPHFRCLDPEEAVAEWLRPITDADVPF